MPASPAATASLVRASREAAAERRRARQRQQALSQATAAAWDALNGLSYAERLAVVEDIAKTAARDLYLARARGCA